MYSAISNITRREREIISAVSHGLNSEEISERFFISVLTVKTHRRNVMQKINAKNMAHLVRKSFELGLIDSDVFEYHHYPAQMDVG